MCPLLWCRESSDSLASTLRHVSECPQLPSTWYWCPYCSRHESFMAYEEHNGYDRQCKLQRKDSKLKRAVTFFKHLGLKNCTRHKTSGSSSAPTADSFDTWLAKPQLEDTSYDVSTRAELADTSNDTHSCQSNSGSEWKMLYEMEGTTLCTSQDPNYLPQYTQESGTAVQPCELDVDPLNMGPQSEGNAANPASPLTGIGAQFEATPDDFEPCEEMLVSPISTIPSSFNYHSTDHGALLHPEVDSGSPPLSNSNKVPLRKLAGHDWSQVDITPSLSGSLPSSENNDNVRDAIALSTQSQAEDLRDIVRVLNEEWMQRCQANPELVPRASVLTPQHLFDTGAQTLQLIFRDILPTTFDAVFALVHVACAAGYIVHRDNSSHCWNEFFQDILKWQFMMPNESDARIFIQLVNLLWWPKGYSAQLCCSNYFIDETSGTLVPLRKPVMNLKVSSSTRTNDLLPSGWPMKPTSTQILNSLKNGPALQECSRFLDGKSTRQISLIIA